MPIRLLSLPSEDLQYALLSMDIGDLIALSLCSKRTKNLVKSSNRKIESICAVVNENRICVRIVLKKYHELPDDPDPQNYEFVAFNVFGSWTGLGSGFLPSIWRKQVHTHNQSDWFVHFLSIFNESMIHKLIIENVNLSYLDTVKQLIPKCQTLKITRLCSANVAKMAFSKLSPIAVKEVHIDNNINENDMSKFLTLNLKSVSFISRLNRFELKLDDLLMSNIATIHFLMILNITGKEINRFLKSEHQFMPIRLLSLSGEDLQYVINSMVLSDLIAFSLCSKRTKALAKSSNHKIDPMSAYVYLNFIIFEIRPSEQERQRSPRLSLLFSIYSGSRITLTRAGENGSEVWRRPEFTQSDWIPHFMSIFNESVIQELNIVEVEESYLDTVKRIIPKFNKLEIGIACFDDAARIAFLKLSPIAVEHVEVQKNIFNNATDTTKFLTLNLKSVTFQDPRYPFKLTVDDLLILNITDLTIDEANITGRELNQFLKLWMKGNHKFYRPKSIRLALEDEEIQLNRQEVLKGIQYEFVEEHDHFQFRIRRGDGKELMVHKEENSIVFNFS
ncbi:hypothetical protein B9Z55_021608 [Caenorhabditis nigoni]|uniref:F-box domain-containing protein n=2 Tax=Caenorhabditis nigoni TaxID=1611254 RepID=A0A2G5TSQ6_9PELO|nr:hypothetical protein B9Z55_021608 [Caenorhabditis nigoni]